MILHIILVFLISIGLEGHYSFFLITGYFAAVIIHTYCSYRWLLLILRVLSIGWIVLTLYFIVDIDMEPYGLFAYLFTTLVPLFNRDYIESNFNYLLKGDRDV